MKSTLCRLGDLRRQKPCAAPTVGWAMASYAASRPAVLDAPPVSGGDVLLVLGYPSWAGAARRHWVHPEDQLTQSLLASPRVSRMLVCNPFRSLPAKLLRPGPAEAP